MERTEAIKRIAEQKLSVLSNDEKSSHLTEWWNMDEGDEDFRSLPYRLKKEMAEIN